MKLVTALLALFPVTCTAQPVLVLMPQGAPIPAQLEPWHHEPFGVPALAASLGLDRWYISPDGHVPANAERSEHILPDGSVATAPDDLMYRYQWALFNDGAKGGKADADTDWLAAWELRAELIADGVDFAPVKIAVVDSRMDQFPGIGNDIPVAGWWNAITGKSSHSGGVCVHSIHVASIAAATPDNAAGISGVCPDASVLAVQVLSGCFGQQPYCASGIVFAADQGVDAINISLQYGYQAHTLLVLACDYAVARGSTIVAASGNFYGANPTVPGSIPSVIAVGALNRLGTRAEWSNKNATLSAPGDLVIGLGNVWSGAAMLPLWIEWSGTSMASPHVAGAAALLRSVNPELTPAQIRAILIGTADDIGKVGHDPDYGAGRLNVYRALHAAIPCRADFNLDGSLSSADFAAFQSAFSEGRHRANMTGDLAADDSPVLTVADFASFQSQFVTGCP